jgi:hypothetical protein
MRDRDRLELAQLQVRDLSSRVLDMQTRQMELMATVDKLAEEVTVLQNETGGGPLGIGMNDSTDRYDDDTSSVIGENADGTVESPAAGAGVGSDDDD